MTIVYAVSQNEYIVSQTSGIMPTLFPAVNVDLKKVTHDFNEAQQLILFLDQNEAETFAQGNSNQLQGKTVVNSSQRAILTMDIDAELLNNKAMQPVQRDIRSDVKFKVNPVVTNTANAYLLNRNELLVPPTLLKLSIGAQSKDFAEKFSCRIL